MISVSSLTSAVEIRILGRNLRDKDVFSKSDPVCVLYMKDLNTGSYYEVGRTEKLNDTVNPDWITKLPMEYRFEEKQLLRFCIYDWDTKSDDVEHQDKLGSAECSLGQIMSNSGSPLILPLGSRNSQLLVFGEEVSDSQEVLTLEFYAKNLDKKDVFGKSDPFLVIYKTTMDSQFVSVYRTEVVKKSLNPSWKRFTVPVSDLCSGDGEKNIKIACYDWDADGDNDLIGECITTLEKLKKGVGDDNVYLLVNPKKKLKKHGYSKSGELILNYIDVKIVSTFLDYIRGGAQLHFTIAVDFTASNGDLHVPGTLHYFQPGEDNQYSLAIKAVGEIIEDYDSDKLFPALGFGGRIPPNWELSHEFYLNGSKTDPYCRGVQGLLQAYQYSLQSVQLYGPTNFSPVVRHVMNFAKAYQGGKHYFVLLIMTDGVISDLADTRRALVEASALPMSVIIVGVGNEDFTNMKNLDSDEQRLNFDGKFAERDIVQFVEMKPFFGQGVQNEIVMKNLAYSVLRELPGQLQQYMQKQ